MDIAAQEVMAMMVGGAKRATDPAERLPAVAQVKGSGPVIPGVDV